MTALAEIVLKLAAGRPRDEIDAEELLKRCPSVDLEALFETARRLGVEAKARHFAEGE